MRQYASVTLNMIQCASIYLKKKEKKAETKQNRLLNMPDTLETKF